MHQKLKSFIAVFIISLVSLTSMVFAATDTNKPKSTYDKKSVTKNKHMIDLDDTVLLLIYHQSGLLTLVKRYGSEEITSSSCGSI